MQRLNARLHAIHWLAEGIHGFELRPSDAQTWPAVTAGAHIDLFLPNGLVRSYSLVNLQGECHRYVIAASLEPADRGGSRYLHETLRVGATIAISAPRNSFPLRESARHTVFFAGGIGITPLWSMAQRLSYRSGSWALYYAARARENAAFADELVALAKETGNTVHLNFDGGAKEKMLDIRGIVASCADDVDLYCCGPVPMLRAFEAACEGRDPAQVHREYFAAPQPVTPPEAGAGAGDAFTVILSRAQKRLIVGPGTNILEAVLDAGVEVPYSCMSGVCRACETGVLAGIPDHRDLVLSDAERAAGSTMMICCSRAQSGELTLDL
ncbi:PDR/VanB family oxidoreductase [Cupriavidus basilensis]